MPINASLSTNRVFTVCVFAITAIAFAVMFVAMPCIADDLWYMSGIHDYKSGIGDASVVSAVADTISRHYLYDNGRMCNIVYSMLMWLPSGLLSALSGLMCAWSLRALAGFSGIRGPQSLAAVWLCLAFAVALPWEDGIFVLCFQFNYVWGMAVAAFAARCFFSVRERPLWQMVLIGLVAGAWHEGFSVPVICGFAAVALARPRRFLTRGRIVMMIAMASGIMWLVLAPSFMRRTTDFAGIASLSSWARAVRVNWPVVLYLLAFAVCAIRRRAASPFALFAAVVSLAAFAIYMNNELGARVAFAGCYFSIAGFFILVRPESMNEGLWKKLLGAVALLFLMVHLAAAVWCTFSFRREVLGSYEKYYALPAGKTVFTDISLEGDMPFMAFAKPYYIEAPRAMYMGMREWEDMSVRPYCPVPVELADVRCDSGVVFPGRSGLRKKDGCFFIPAERLGVCPDVPFQLWGMVGFGERGHSRIIYLTPFVSEADGRKYLWVVPMRTYPFDRFISLTSIDW